MAEVAQAVVALVPSARGFGKGVQKQLAGDLSGVGRKQGRGIGGRMAAGLGSALKGGAVTAAVTAGVAVGTAMTGGFRSAISQENTEKTLKGLYGSAGSAADMMGRLRKVASGSPISYDAYSKGAQSLAYMGVEGKQAASILENVGAAVTASGGGSEEMGRASDALLKMVNAGEVQLDTLNQLSESGTPIFSGLAAHFGTSIKDVRTMVEDGKVGIDDVLSVTEKASGKTFKSMKKASDEVSKSFGSQWKIAKDNVMVAIGQNMRPAIERLTPVIGAAGGAIAGFVNDFGAGEGAAGRFRATLGRVKDLLSTGFGAALSTLGPVASKAFGGMRAAAAALMPHIRTFVSSMAALGPKVMALGRTIGTFLVAAFQAFKPYLTAVAGLLAGAFVVALKIIPPILSALMSTLSGVLTVIRPLLPLIAALTAAWAAYRLGIMAASLATRAWSAVMLASRTIMAAGRALITAYRVALLGLGAAQMRAAVTARARNVAEAAGMAVSRAKLAVTRMGTLATLRQTVAEKAKLVLTKAITVATKAWVVVQRALNMAMRKNPIGMVVTALALLVGGLILAYKRSETFRRIVQGAWNGIKAAALAVVNWFKNTAWPWMKQVFQSIGSWAMRMWRSYISPAFRSIWSLVRQVAGWLKNTAWPWIKSVFDGIGRVARWLWNKAIKPYFGFVFGLWRKVFGWLKNTGWAWIRSAFNWIADKAKWLYTSYIKPYFNFIRRIASSVFGWIKNTGWPWIRAAFNWIADKAKWLWEKIKESFNWWLDKAKAVFGWIKNTGWKWIRRAFNNIASKASWLWDKVKWAFDKMKDGGSKLKDAFVKVRDGIERAWSKIYDYVKSPIVKAIKWMNKYFIRNINKMLSKIPGVDFRVKPLGEWGFAKGGYTGPGSKYQPAGIVHADEYVVQKSSRRRFERENPGALDHINRTGTLPGHSGGGLVGGMPGYAKGGMVYRSMAWWVKKNLPGVRITSGYRPGAITAAGRPSDHGAGKAIDLAPSMRTFNAIKSEFGSAIKSLIYSPANGRQVLNGKNFMYGQPARGNHWDHVHWAMNSMKRGSGAGGGGGGGWLPEWLSNPGKWIQDRARNLLKKVSGDKYGIAGKTLPGIGSEMMKGVAKKVKETFTLPTLGGGGGGVEKWRGTVQRALKIMGLPSSYADMTLRRMDQESSGRARAINNYDSNAMRGTPSKGLMQVIDPTWRAYRHPRYNDDIYDPLSNILASMRYAISRYGSLGAAYNKSGGYSSGGLVTPAVFDNGGTLAPGVNVVHNKTGRPEPMVREDRIEQIDYDRLAKAIAKQVGPAVYEGSYDGTRQQRRTEYARTATKPGGRVR